MPKEPVRIETICASCGDKFTHNGKGRFKRKYCDKCKVTKTDHFANRMKWLAYITEKG